ncbi:ATP-grasp domain-containing protein [Pseudomonas massiliensis]|uniref:hypothetical protein n=1 Tax=Pseudomonas massiliensis TaxID=522492 RepID=UPI00058D40E0|nr:hypothetical protein [Pseudomonas massiliensis]
MANDLLLILGIGPVALKYLETALAGHGLEPLVLGPRQHLPAQTWQTFSPSRFHDVPLTREGIEGFLQRHARLRDRIRAVTTLFDEQLPLVEAIARAHGWAYPGPAAVRLSDKSTASAYAGDFSVPSETFSAFEPERLEPFLAEPGRRWVIKPGCCSGGHAVGHVEGGPGALAQVRVHLAQHHLVTPDSWILQPCLEGRLISFEGYMRQGQLCRAGVSLRVRIGLTEVANRFPSTDGLDRTQLEHGWSALERLFQTAGFKDGWFHSECIAGPAGLRLIDANPGRIGGATVLEQVALAWGHLPTELLAHVLLLPIGEAMSTLEARLERPKPTLGVWYGLWTSARLNSVTVPASRAWHTQFAAEESHVPAMGTSDYAWVGLVSGEEQAVRQCLAGLGINTDLGPASPAYRLD